MTEIKVGDEIKVTTKGKVTDTAPWGGGYVFVNGAKVFIKRPGVEVEVLTPADDPSKDPVGTLRQQPHNITPYVKLGPNRWQHFTGGADNYDDNFLRGYPVVGAVPGTPAAKAQAPVKPQVVQYGDPEPDRSKKFKEPDGYIWSFFSGQWGWSRSEGSRWEARGPFTSVTVSEFPWVEVVS